MRVDTAPHEPRAPHALQTLQAPAQYLTFGLAGETFGMAILVIKEIIEYRAPTEVPLGPRQVRGVINLRGAVVPVVDPLACFGQAPSAVSKRSCIVIVEVAQQGERQVIGLLVDAVNEVLEIDAAEVEPPPEFGARIRGEFIAGIGRVRGSFVTLLDVERVLATGSGGAALIGTASADAVV